MALAVVAASLALFAYAFFKHVQGRRVKNPEADWWLVTAILSTLPLLLLAGSLG